jgi:hypothetical protein
MKILNETTVFQPKTIEVLVETQEEHDALVKFVTDKSNADGWISNIGNDTYRWPDGFGINEDTKLEVEKRNGCIGVGLASEWDVSWCEMARHNTLAIVRFRIIK